MRSPVLPFLAGALLLVSALFPSCRGGLYGPGEPVGDGSGGEPGAEVLRRALAHSPPPEVPPDPTNAVADDASAAWLGQALFYDARLSRDGSVSCATCHDPERAFTDGRRISVGLERGRRHTPSLLDVAGQRWFFWDGRADSLWAQALAPLEATAEHDSDRVSIVRTIAEDPRLAAGYERAFGPLPDVDGLPAAKPNAPEGDPRRDAWEALSDAARAEIDVAFVNLGKAIAAYERRLVTGPTRFDRFAAAVADGDASGGGHLTAEELHGLELFVGEANCRSCHAGPGFSDREFHDTRVAPLDGARATDPGRYEGIALVRASRFNGTGEFSDAPGDEQRRKLQLRRSGETWGQFKTPSLRNVSRTAPYMHQGQFDTLEEVVRFYSTLEGSLPPHDHGEVTMVPLELTDEEERALVAFLRTLDGELPPDELLGPPDVSAPRAGSPTSPSR